jgi:hypothetical protein
VFRYDQFEIVLPGMKILFLRFITIVCAVALQLSFFDIAFPWFHVPLLLIACVTAWTLALGFPESLKMTVPLTVIFEILSVGTVGAFSLYAVLLAYAVSFLSRRILVGQHGAGAFLYAIFTSAMALVYQGMMYLLLHGRTDVAESDLLRLPSEFSPGMLLLSAVLAVLAFLIAYPAILRFEERAKLIVQKQFLNVR